MAVNSSSLAEKLVNGQPTMTVEISPPKGTDISRFLDLVRPLVGKVDAINVPDCQRSILKMSSMAASKLLQDELGVDTVWQLTSRDRNVIALQADLMGGWALGLRNVLALTGDPVQVGDQADVAKQVSHVDALRLIELINGLNKDLDATGRELPRQGTRFCVGAALNPHKMSRDAQIHRLELKLKLGVEYLQTQPVYDVQTIKDCQDVINRLCDKLRRKPPRLMVGIIPPKSGDFARFMNQKILGIQIPNAFITRLDQASDPVGESFAYCRELMSELSGITNSFHIMPVGVEKHVEQLLV